MSEIKTVDKLAKETQRRIEDDTTKHEGQNQQNYDNKKIKLREEISILKKSLQETVLANRETEQQLRKV